MSIALYLAKITTPPAEDGAWTPPMRQVCLRSMAQPLGPGPIAVVEQGMTAADTIYSITTPGIIATAQGQRRVDLPVMFCGADVAWIADPPIEPEKPAIIAPPPGMSRGGLHIG